MPRACSYVKHSVTLCGGERKPGTWARARLRCLWHVPQALCTAIPVPPGEACGGTWCVLGACMGGSGITATTRRLSCPPGPRGASTGCRASPRPASTPAYSRSPGLRPADASQTPIHQSPLCSHHPDELMNGGRGGGGSTHAFSWCGIQRRSVGLSRPLWRKLPGWAPSRGPPFGGSVPRSGSAVVPRGSSWSLFLAHAL